jgi:hypothetical protein
MNQQLVKGAAQVAASKRSTWNEAFQKNLTASLNSLTSGWSSKKYAA